MSQDFSDICRQGYVRHRTKKLPTWNKRWLILCKRSSKGKPRIEKYADERSAQLRNDPKSVELLGVKNAVRCPGQFKKYAVSIEFREGNNDLLFCLESDYDADEWLNHILAVCSLDYSLPPIVSSWDIPSSSSVFPVYLLPSPLLSCYGECLMGVTCEEVLLRHLDEHPQPTKEIASWKLATLRRYGRDDNKFMFECGRSSKTGEGLFIFNTMDGELIYKTVHSATLSIASAHSVARTPQNRMSVSHSLSHDPAPRTPERKNTNLRSTKSSPADRAPLPLPRLDQRPKPRAPSPPPTFEPISDFSGNRNSFRPRAPSPPAPDSDSDKDDYEILAEAVTGTVRPSYPIRSVDSMLSVDDPTAQCLSPTTTSRAPDITPRISSPARDTTFRTPGAGYSTALTSVPDTAAATGSTEMNNNEDGGVAVGGDMINNNNEEVIYEEKYLAAPFRQFLQLRKEDKESEIQFV